MSNPKDQLQSAVEQLISAGSSKNAVLTALTQITIDLMDDMRLERKRA
ncbi:hypothetical protein [Mesorhizobium sp.]|nr:hypothetical protein [Mesorhizobium sp.]